MNQFAEKKQEKKLSFKSFTTIFQLLLNLLLGFRRIHSIRIYSTINGPAKGEPQKLVWGASQALITAVCVCIILSNLFLGIQDSRTTFLVDRFHDRIHCCSPIFSMKTYNVDEVRNKSTLFISEAISTQVAYMEYSYDTGFLNAHTLSGKRYFTSTKYPCTDCAIYRLNIQWEPKWGLKYTG